MFTAESLPADPIDELAPPIRYTPFDAGKYDMSPGLSHLRIAPEDPLRRLIQLDREYPAYRANKQACRAEKLSRYSLEHALPAATRQRVNQLLIEQLCASYPAWFQRAGPQQLACRLSGDLLSWGQDGFHHPGYTSLFDALAAQMQEDLAIWQLDGERDWLAALHVCAPNGWAPGEKIGQSFAQVHLPVPGMERQRANYLPMLAGLIRKPAFCRFIWDLRTDPELNHQPEHRAELDPEGVDSPPFSLAAPVLWVRLERQLLYGLPDCNAVLFMIRTYRYPVESLTSASLAGLDRALAQMSPKLLAYKRLEAAPLIRSWLQSLIASRSD